MATLTATASEATNECPVCYGDCGTNPKLACAHGLCATCEAQIRSMPRAGGGQCCPLCRTAFDAAAAPAPAPTRPIYTGRRLAENLTTSYGRAPAPAPALVPPTVEVVEAFRQFVRDTDGMREDILNLSSTISRAQQLLNERRAALNRVTQAFQEAYGGAGGVLRTGNIQIHLNARPRRQGEHDCGVRGCLNGNANLVHVLGYTRRVWRCHEHQ